MKRAEPFESLAPFYDLSYKEKPYLFEAKQLNDFIRTRVKKRQIDLLDLGCGTGEHIKLFSKLGYICTGVDISPKMVALAKQKLAAITPLPTVIQADLKSLTLPKKFDVVVSLFHVLSYMVTDDEIDAFFQTARKHLAPNGIFIFDCWNGKGVLSNPPEIRYKKVFLPAGILHRIKIPTINKAENSVNVIHHGFLLSSGQSMAQHFEEKHVLRYFFANEIKRFAKRNGLLPINESVKMRGMADQWDAIFACKLQLS